MRNAEIEIENLIRLKQKQDMKNERNFALREKLSYLKDQKNKYEIILNRLKESKQQQNDLASNTQDNLETQEYIHSLNIQKAKLHQEMELLREKIQYDLDFDNTEDDLQNREIINYSKFLKYKDHIKDKI